MNFNQLSRKQKKFGILVIILLFLFFIRSCGSSNSTSPTNQDSSIIPLNMLLAANNKNAADDDKFYQGNNNEYLTKSGFSISSISSKNNVPMGIIYICNKDLDSTKLQTKFLQLVATIQNRKSLASNDGEQLINDLHLNDVNDASVYQGKLGQYHFKKVSYNSVNIGNITGLQIPVTVIYFYPDGEKETIRDDDGKELSFDDYVRKTITNEICQLDRQRYLYDTNHPKESRLQPIK